MSQTQSPILATATDRMEVLDGLRAIACLAVVGFHYFSRWTPPRSVANLYPYGGLYAGFPVFNFGYLGVNLFFLVSGFVISLTLTRCEGAAEFIVRRIARLLPPMLLAASATFVVLTCLPPHLFATQACNFLPSLTFTDPGLWRGLSGLDCHFMDNAYWTLYVEVRFYAWAAILYYGAARQAFLRLAATVMLAAIGVSVIERVAGGMPGLALANALFFPRYAPWLFSGVAFYFIWQDRRNRMAWGMLLAGLAANVARSVLDVGGVEWLLLLGIYATFGAFALRLGGLRLLTGRWLTSLGAASYMLYLLHQDIGVTVIAALAAGLRLSERQAVLVPLGVAVALALVSVGIYRVYEVPARRVVTAWGLRLIRR